MKVWRNFLLYLFIMVAMLHGLMYLLLDVWHWRLFASSFVTGPVFILMSYYLQRWLGIEAAMRREAQNRKPPAKFDY